MHSKQWHYSLHRDFQNCYSTRRSPTGFFSSNSSSNPTRASTYNLHVHITLQRILHPESSSTCRRQRALRVLLLHSRGQRDLHSRRNSTHTRQGDLLEIHPCALQDIPGIPATRPSKGTPVITDIPVFPDIPDIPVIHDLPAFPGNSTNSTMFQGIDPIPAFSD